MPHKRTFRTPNTSTMLFKFVQDLRGQLKETETEVKDIQKSIHSLNEEQKKHIDQDEPDMFIKTYKKKSLALKKKDHLEDRKSMIERDIKSVRLFIQKGGRKKRKTQKKRRK